MALGEITLNEKKDKVYNLTNTVNSFDQKHWKIIKSWPEKIEIQLDNKNILFVHGDPNNYSQG